MSTPLIAIIDWAASPLDDSDAAVERAVIGDAARVKRFLCASDTDFDEEICGADAIKSGTTHRSRPPASIAYGTAKRLFATASGSIRSTLMRPGSWGYRSATCRTMEPKKLLTTQSL